MPGGINNARSSPAFTPSWMSRCHPEIGLCMFLLDSSFWSIALKITKLKKEVNNVRPREGRYTWDRCSMSGYSEQEGTEHGVRCVTHKEITNQNREHKTWPQTDTEGNKTLWTNAANTSKTKIHLHNLSLTCYEAKWKEMLYKIKARYSLDILSCVFPCNMCMWPNTWTPRCMQSTIKMMKCQQYLQH